jgi:hypothetical protein
MDTCFLVHISNKEKRRQNFRRQTLLSCVSLFEKSSDIFFQPVIPTRSEIPERREPVEDRRNIGEFPYRRGETPIFNFDDGDEAFVQVSMIFLSSLEE